MYQVTQKHPQFSELIQHDSQPTELDCKKLILKTAGLTNLDLSNIDDHKTEINSHNYKYHISGSDYWVTKPLITMAYAGAEQENKQNN